MAEAKKINATVKYGELVAKCWEDEALKARFIKTPEDVLEEFGVPVEEGIEYKVIEQPKNVHYIVLPRKDTKKALAEISKLFLAKADKTEKILPAGTEVRIIQDTDDTNYLILPVSPKALTAAELGGITGGDKVATYSNVAAQTQVVAQVVEAEEVVTTTTTVAEGEIAVAGVVAAVGAIVLI